MSSIAYTVFDEGVHGNVTMTGSVQHLSDVVSKVVTIQADPANSTYVYIGFTSGVSATSWGAKLSAGGSVTLNINNLNLVYVKGTASDVIGYIVER
jgi:hypothetical protein